MKKILFLSGLLTPLSVFAHVKWFVDSQEVTALSHGTVDFYSVASLPVLLWILIAVVVVYFFSYLDKKVEVSRKLVEFGRNHETGIHRVAQAILGIFLVTITLVWKIIIAPDYKVLTSLDYLLSGLQLAVGLMFIFNFKPRWASLGLGFLCLTLVFASGPVAFVENLMVFALAFYFYTVNSKNTKLPFSKNPLKVLRISTGIALILLAFTEKLLYPELSLQFLSVHSWNFMQTIFPWFSNKLFVLSTGFAEIIFGLLFIKGVMTRTTTVLIALFFACSVVTMLVSVGAWEVEDLVVYVAAILFVFYGGSKER